MDKVAGQFLAVTFSLMLLCWGGCAACSLFGVFLSAVPLLYIPYLLGGLSPTVASYVVLKHNGNISSFRDWLKSVFDLRHNLCAYLLLPLFAGLFFLCLCGISGYEPGAPLFALVFLIPMMLFGGGVEETGWRGVLFPELEKIWGYTVATVMTAVIWWIWHLPLFFINGVSQYGGDFLSFGLNVLGLSFGLSAIKKTTGSTWLCVLFHCLINSLHSVFLVNENRFGSVITAAVLIFASCIVANLHKKKAFCE